MLIEHLWYSQSQKHAPFWVTVFEDFGVWCGVSWTPVICVLSTEGRLFLNSEVSVYVIPTTNNTWRVQMCRYSTAVGFSSVLGNLGFVCMVNMSIFMYLLRFWCVTIALSVKCLGSHGRFDLKQQELYIFFTTAVRHKCTGRRSCRLINSC
jgi:hypothetical protein